MSDQFWNRFSQFPRNHVPVVQSDTVPLVREMLIMALADGNIAAVDAYDRVVVYTVTAGTILPIVAKRINDTNTTLTNAQLIGLY